MITLGVGHWQQRRNRKVVERTPVQHLLNDGVGTVHAVIDGPDPAPAALRSLAHLVRRPPFRPQPGLREKRPHPPPRPSAKPRAPRPPPAISAAAGAA